MSNLRALMEAEEPLLPTVTPSRRKPTPPSILCPLPEDGEVSIPLTPPSSFKDRLIFGPPLSPSDHHLFLSASTQPSGEPEASSSSYFVPLFPSSSSSSSNNNINNDNAFFDEEKQSSSSSSSWLLDPFVAGKSKGNLHRSRTAPAMAAINEVLASHHHHQPGEAPPPRRPSIVRQAILLLLLYLLIGASIYIFNRTHFSAVETHPIVDAFYFCIVTMCTIGYGDITPATTSAKLFSITFVLVGFGFVDILLSGMVSYVLDLQESVLLSAANASRLKRSAPIKPGHKDVARSYIIDVKKGRMRIRLKVAIALGVVVLCIGVGTAVLCFVERLSWLDSFYLSVMSVTTVGYGDRAFKTMPGRLFACGWLLFSTLAVARAFLYLAEARIDKRHREMAKWVLGRDMTVSEFLAADIDNNGFVTKSEFVIYKLKEMGKITEKDILQICDQFSKLDTGDCGKITLSDLIESHH